MSGLDDHDPGLVAAVEALPAPERQAVGACGAMFTRMIAGVEEQAGETAAGLAVRVVQAIIAQAEQVKAGQS